MEEIRKGEARRRNQRERGRKGEGGKRNNKSKKKLYQSLVVAVRLHHHGLMYLASEWGKSSSAVVQKRSRKIERAMEPPLFLSPLVLPSCA